METNYGQLRVQSLQADRVRSAAEEVAHEPDAVAAGKQFEELFASMLVKEMRRGLDEGFFGQGHGAQVFEGWLDGVVGRALVEGKGLGIADSIERSLRPPASTFPTDPTPSTETTHGDIE